MENSYSNPSFGWVKANKQRRNCKFCGKSHTFANIRKHERSCRENPKNQKSCPVCCKMFAGSSVTCSCSCSNKLFRTGRTNTHAKQGNTYRYICFSNHKKECLICGESNVVSVHHLNENHQDNRPENLIPLCPTHHQYMHSHYRSLIEPQVLEYIEKFKSTIGIVL